MNWNLLIDGSALYEAGICSKTGDNLQFPWLIKLISEKYGLKSQPDINFYFSKIISNQQWQSGYRARDYQLQKMAHFKRMGLNILEFNQDDVDPQRFASMYTSSTAVCKRFWRNLPYHSVRFTTKISYILGMLHENMPNHRTFIISDDPVLRWIIEEQQNVSLVFFKNLLARELWSLDILNLQQHKYLFKEEVKFLKFKGVSSKSEVGVVLADKTARTPVNRQALKELI
jgi:hypothetical protein